jgi:hypothetical protein
MMQSSERYLIAVAAMDRYRYCGRYRRYLLPCLDLMIKQQVEFKPTRRTPMSAE